MRLAQIVMAIRDQHGQAHIKRLDSDASLGDAARQFTESLISRGRHPKVLLVALPGGKTQ